MNLWFSSAISCTINFATSSSMTFVELSLWIGNQLTTVKLIHGHGNFNPGPRVDPDFYSLHFLTWMMFIDALQLELCLEHRDDSNHSLSWFTINKRSLSLVNVWQCTFHRQFANNVFGNITFISLESQKKLQIWTRIWFGTFKIPKGRFI